MSPLKLNASPLTASTSTTAEVGGDDGMPALHPDIIESHVLTRLDGPSLASAATCSATLHHLSSQNNLWSDICHSTWPSTTSPCVSHVISTFPDGGPRAFFSQAFPLLVDRGPVKQYLSHSSLAPPSELLSAVDIHYRVKLIFTKVQETETVTGWFRCSPFRIDLLEPKDVVPTPIKHPDGDETCREIKNDMSLSWILIDPIGRQAMNLSSHKPVTVQRHWLTGELQARFATILAADQGHVQCGIVVTCGASEGGEMQVSEISLQMEDMDGMHLNGKDSLVILEKNLKGKKGKGRNRVKEAERRYKEYLEMKEERRERKLRREEILDILCVVFGVSIFSVAFWCFIMWRIA